MKRLTDYIKESIEAEVEHVNESSTNKWFRIDISDFPGTYDSLKHIADRKKLYNEPIDNGIKIEVKEGQADRLSAIIELLTELVNSKQEDETLKGACDKLREVIDEMNNYMDEKSEEAEEKSKAEEEDAKEAERKAKEEAEKADKKDEETEDDEGE